jgi:hypothetical protein
VTTDFDAKFAELRVRLIDPGDHRGALLIVYDPAEEHAFRRRYELFARELSAKRIDHVLLPLNRLPFEALEQRGLLEKAFRLEFSDPLGMRQSLASLLHREVIRVIRGAAEKHAECPILLQRTASLFPWVSYSAVLSELENELSNALVVPFPGSEHGPLLRFLGEKDGYNYRATRI